LTNRLIYSREKRIETWLGGVLQPQQSVPAQCQPPSVPTIPKPGYLVAVRTAASAFAATKRIEEIRDEKARYRLVSRRNREKVLTTWDCDLP
jgi:hypothetical protein